MPMPPQLHTHTPSGLASECAASSAVAQAMGLASARRALAWASLALPFQRGAFPHAAGGLLERVGALLLQRTERGLVRAPSV